MRKSVNATIIGSLCFVLLGVLLLLFSDDTKDRYVAWIGIIFFGLCASYSLWYKIRHGNEFPRIDGFNK